MDDLNPTSSLREKEDDFNNLPKPKLLPGCELEHLSEATGQSAETPRSKLVHNNICKDNKVYNNTLENIRHTEDKANNMDGQSMDMEKEECGRMENEDRISSSNVEGNPEELSNAEENPIRISKNSSGSDGNMADAKMADSSSKGEKENPLSDTVCGKNENGDMADVEMTCLSENEESRDDDVQISLLDNSSDNEQDKNGSNYELDRSSSSSNFEHNYSSLSKDVERVTQVAPGYPESRDEKNYESGGDLGEDLKLANNKNGLNTSDENITGDHINSQVILTDSIKNSETSEKVQTVTNINLSSSTDQYESVDDSCSSKQTEVHEEMICDEMPTFLKGEESNRKSINSVNVNTANLEKVQSDEYKTKQSENCNGTSLNKLSVNSTNITSNEDNSTGQVKGSTNLSSEVISKEQCLSTCAEDSTEKTRLSEHDNILQSNQEKNVTDSFESVSRVNSESPCSTSSLTSEDKSNKCGPQDKNMASEPPSSTNETIDVSKNIKSEPIDTDYEKSVHIPHQSSNSNNSSPTNNLPSLVVHKNVKTEVTSPPSNSGKSCSIIKESSSKKSATTKTTSSVQKSKMPMKVILPAIANKNKLPITIVNSDPSMPCSYLIPVNTSLTSVSQYSTFITSTSNGKTILKQVSVVPKPKDSKNKRQQAKAVTPTVTIVPQMRNVPNTFKIKIPVKTTTKTTITSTKTANAAKPSTNITSLQSIFDNSKETVDFRIKSLDIAGISELIQRKNLENVYKPPTPPIKSQSLSMTYLCTECGDSFLVEASLKHHFARCSMVIQYFCKACKIKLLFTNKCSLLKHLRCHSNSPDLLSRAALQIKADNISVLSLLEGNMPKIEKLSSAMIEIDPKRTTIVKPKNDNPCPECGVETHLNISHHFGSLGVICNFKNMCKDCFMFLPTSCSLHAHRRIHKYEQPHVCPECGITFGCVDSFKTHITEVCFHFNRIPVYICPVCNVYVWKASSLKQHFVLEHQGIFYRDKRCHAVFPSYEQYIEHRDKVHTGNSRNLQVYFYCHICKGTMLLKLLLNHMYSHINKVKHNIPFGYICITCRDEKQVSRIFFAKNDLLKHLELHKKGETVPCPKCHMMFVSDSELEQHQTENHKNSEENVCKYCRIAVTDMEFHLKHCEFGHVVDLFENCVGPDCSKIKEVDHMKEFFIVLNTLNHTSSSCKITNFGDNIKKTGLVCTFCNTGGYKNDKELARHISTHVKDRVFICNKCQRKDFKTFGDMKSHQIVCGLDWNCSDDIMMVSAEEFSCIDCDKYFRDKVTLDKHRKEEHAFYPCILCGLTYSTDIDLEQHMNSVHRCKKLVSLSCSLCKGKKGKGKTFMRREFYDSHMATIHGVVKPVDAVSLLKRKRESNDAVLPLKRLKVSEGDQFSCAKCEFSTSDSDSFTKHIAKHKRNESSIQCPQCGLCFSVVPSLKRHLFLVHKIKDADQFIKDSNIVIPEEEDISIYSMEEPSTYTDSSNKHKSPDQASDNPKECFVCNRVFETEAEKKFHMRTHGMAFISSRRRQLTRSLDVTSKIETDVVKSEPNLPATPEKCDVQSNNKSSPISVTKSVRLSDKSKILQPSNQPVVTVERMEIKMKK